MFSLAGDETLKTQEEEKIIPDIGFLLDDSESHLSASIKNNLL